MVINPMRIQEQTDDLAQLLAKKNADYGNSFEEQFNEYGLTSVLIRLDDKLRRLKNLNKNEAQVNESITDTLQDIAGYAILASILTDNENR
ncbi:MAG: nucleotide modification associated domain-containing protein [Solibacillus sp.]|uniref:nucleotide modification associated domain-containing protein n=1 Tax=Solibacillus sp. TaxID=1909654 RepID=UPI003315D9AE